MKEYVFSVNQKRSTLTYNPENVIKIRASRLHTALHRLGRELDERTGLHIILREVWTVKK